MLEQGKTHFHKHEKKSTFFSGKAIDHIGCNTGGATALIRIFCLANSQRESLVKLRRMLGRGVDLT